MGHPVYYSKSVCLFVWPAIDSAPGGHTDMRPLSLEPLSLKEVPSGEKFPEKWSVAKLLKTATPPMLFLWHFEIQLFLQIFLKLNNIYSNKKQEKTSIFHKKNFKGNKSIDE